MRRVAQIIDSLEIGGYMTDKEFNKYLNKYKYKYKISKFSEEDPFSVIEGKYGTIEPYGEGKLEIHFDNDFQSTKLSEEKVLK